MIDLRIVAAALLALVAATGCSKGKEREVATSATPAPSADSTTASPEHEQPSQESLRARQAQLLASAETAVPWTHELKERIHTEVDRRRARVEGPTDGGAPPGCSEHAAIWQEFNEKKATFKDEFEREQARRAVEPRANEAAKKCWDRLREGPDEPFPELVVAEVSMAPEDSDYSFADGGFFLKPASCRKGRNCYEAIRLGPGALVIGADAYRLSECHDSDGFLDVEGLMVPELRAGFSESILSEWRWLLPVVEAEGPAIKARLAANKPATEGTDSDIPRKNLRLQILFQPTGWGETSLACRLKIDNVDVGVTAAKGFTGQAVGYRVIDDVGPFGPWRAARLDVGAAVGGSGAATASASTSTSASAESSAEPSASASAPAATATAVIGAGPGPGAAPPARPKVDRQACLSKCVAGCNDDAACERSCASSKCQ